jgi:hypothetical protein
MVSHSPKVQCEVKKEGKGRVRKGRRLCEG